ncbi:MAG: hypothetical protein HOA15_02690 [Candidatus Marinimicrobia bacterium]|jgi:hypothetical protein|nr:hypothetical protein [Candidatus Neomarinimicrobiota bacterium]MBT4372283.1 hypothetical protein [Candidatus Neomarinimicrobiota bacterium]MBT6840803.1 hypothetical protein [Candidatus Neomarinimicrobiota bacterium]MBT7495737.1 hypothetical protein [Candidatus Neomarinimicrobiota bacterium]
MKIRSIFIITILLIGGLFAQGKTFFLKSGDKVSGTLTAETDSTFTVETSFGSVTINKKDIKQEEAIIYLKSGDKLKGVILSESDEGIKVKAQFGEVDIPKEKIERIDFKSMGAVARGFQRPGQTEEGRWYYGKERLIDIYFDPTGYTVGDNVLYLSLLSWGYGLSDRFQVTSKWGGYFLGDLNFRPKYTVFKKGTLKSEHAFAIGAHFHMRGYPTKYELKTVKDYSVNWENETDTTWYEDRNEWRRVGEEGYLFDEDRGGDKMWMEYFAAYTLSNLKKSGQGRINHTIGATLTTYPGYDPMPRAYYAIDADARRNLKLIFEVFYDPYWASNLEYAENKNVSDIDFDFGFIYAYNEALQLGIHFQRPHIAFYYKF